MAWQPKPGVLCKVPHLPQCNFCGDTARFDFMTAMGRWAHGCPSCWEMYRAYSTLGVGKAQMWMTADEMASDALPADLTVHLREQG